MSIERDILDALILLLGGTIGRRVPGLSYLGENITNYNWIMVKVTIVLWLIVMKDLVNVSYMTLISFRTASKKLAKDIPFSS